MMLRLAVLAMAIMASSGCAAAAGNSGVTAGSGGGLALPFPEIPSFDKGSWRTDFSRHSVPLSEISSGGPGKDGIPAIDQPRFLSASAQIPWLKDQEPVVALVQGGEARAYPIQILIWHEIVNDTVGGVPVTVTFCPLCNTAIAFDRRAGGAVLDFGTTGNLRYSDLVMYDRQTESWWQQVTGEAIVGELTGQQLRPLPAAITSWRDFRNAYPTGRVLSQETGHVRSYGRNPYTGYDDVNATPFLYRGPSDGRLPPMARVVAVSLGGQHVAYPFRVLEERRVINHRVGGTDLVVLWSHGTASPLDAPDIASGRDIGATGVFQATLEGRRLTFAPGPEGAFIDQETGTSWNLLGQGVRGPLAGKELVPVVHGTHFWFAWAIFRPQTLVYQP
ncbi:MAG: DUF3179 domain-containing protein [Chloroflexi bacterium]|nr:DUF3179 domain-containing protein [Chloroflexota bacterium]